MLTLEDIRMRLGWNPWHFWGFAHAEKAPITGRCDDVVYEFGYQDGDMAGRFDLAEKIVYCHDTVAEFLRYDVGLRYREEKFAWPPFVNQVWTPNRRVEADGRWMGVNLRRAELDSLGYLRRDLIETSAVVLRDVNGDGLNEEFVITVTTTVTDPAQIVVYFTEDDLPATVEDRYSIRYKVAPVKVTISNGTATIRGAAWMLGKPNIYEYQVKGQALDPTNLNNFALQLDVIREWIDPNGLTAATAQVVLNWESLPSELGSFCYVSGLTSDPAATSSVIGRAAIRDAHNGIAYVGEALYNATSQTWSAVHWGTCRPPDTGVIRYRAGVPLTNTWRQALTKFVVAEMPRRLCACDTANKALYEWQFDLARTGGNDGESYGMTPQTDLNNPLGTRRGHVQLWNYIEPLMRDRPIRI